MLTYRRYPNVGLVFFCDRMHHEKCGWRGTYIATNLTGNEEGQPELWLCPVCRSGWDEMAFDWGFYGLPDDIDDMNEDELEKTLRVCLIRGIITERKPNESR